MNPDNYASLEASRRLVEAGIVLETEAVWALNQWPESTRDGRIVYKEAMRLIEKPLIPYKEQYPAPCMTEVWRELPPEDVLYHYFDKYKHFFWYDWKVGQVFSDVNPTDALIDLLIFVRKQEGGRG